VGSFPINEYDVGSIVGAAASLYLSYRMLKFIMNQNEHKNKSKKDLD